MSATLGGLIKDYRLQKNLSQMEVAFALGWSETSRLSRIEQGKVGNPSREFIDRLIKIMKLEEEEKNNLLLIGNYIPNDEEIEKIKEEVSPFLQKWRYPALLFDFSWRIIETNDSFDSLKQISGLKNRQKLGYILEDLFDPNFTHNKYLRDEELVKWHEYQIRLLTQYQYLQKTRTKENWYVKFIKKMMNNKLFRELWQKALMAKEIDVIGNFGLKSVISGKDHSERKYYYFFVMPVIKDPRFQVELYLPVDAKIFT